MTVSTTTTERKKYKDYETAMNRLEEITALLETGGTSLEDAIKLYTEGLEIARFCDKKLTEAEAKIKVITEKNGVLSEVDFGDKEESD
jgi:exodeoxyribonuclease VII small subunit